MNADVKKGIELKSITFCKYRLKTINKDIVLSFPQLLDLRNQINKLSLHHSLESIIETENFVLLFVADRQHLIYFEVPDLIALRQQLDGLFRATQAALF